ncbi:hypothetical protein, partial [Vreelandella arctica]|uniref:hypothetical protein n=1 Tax=Vreelandella arctica TaxID=3126499 RepID=UPI00300E377B
KRNRLTHRDRSAYKTLSSVKAVCKSVTITGMTGHVRRNTQLYRNTPKKPLNGEEEVDSEGGGDIVRLAKHRVKKECHDAVVKRG